MNINVLRYACLKSFLGDFVEQTKKDKSSWSISGWSKRIGLKSTTSLTMIINGQRNCGPVVGEALLKYFKFSEIEKKHFLFLVERSKVRLGNPALDLIDAEILSVNRAKKAIHLNAAQMAAIKNGYYFSIRQLARIVPLQKNENWLRSKLNYSGDDRLLAAAEKLFELGFLEDCGETYNGVEISLLSETEIDSEAIKQYHEDMGGLGLEAIRKYDVNQRCLQGCTLKIKKEKIEVAKYLIEKFMSDFESIVDDNDGTSIYQLNLQFFPLAIVNV